MKLPFVVDSTQPDLGGNLRHGDLGGFTPKVWDWVIHRFAIKSMLDVGCGEGHAVDYFRRLGVISHGVDGLLTNVRRAVTPIALHDLKTAAYTMPVDLVLCIEVVEHVDERYVDNLVQTLCNGKIILMTHALPDQEGHHHVNCKASQYWIGKLETAGYDFYELETNYIRTLAGNEGWWNHVTRSGLVFGASDVSV